MITYFLQASLCWSFFLMVYQFFLRNETFFKINRFYLLSTLILGFAIPYLRIRWQEIYSDTFEMSLPLQGGAYILEFNPLHGTAGKFNTVYWLQKVYWIGFAISLVWLSIDIIAILKLIFKNAHQKMVGYTLINTESEHLPFSFFNFVFISKKVQFKDPDLERILQHEYTHVRDWHSLDILLIEVLKTMLWWNPFMYWYRQALRNTHEYVADAQVLKSTDTIEYGSLLVKNSQRGLQLALANHFIYSQLKNRINMMLKFKSNPINKWKYIMVFPTLLLLAVLFAYRSPDKNLKLSDGGINADSQKDSLPSNVTYVLNGKFVTKEFITNIYPDQIVSMNVLKGESATKKYNKESGKNGIIEIITKPKYIVDENEVTKEEYQALEQSQIFSKTVVKYGGQENGLTIIELNKMDEKVVPHELYKVVEEMPRFPGCEEAKTQTEREACSNLNLMKYIYSNIKYPKLAKENGIDGRVVVSFVVEENGSISNAKVVEDIGGDCGNEVIRVVNLMNTMPQKWIPGKHKGNNVAVQYQMPISFRLDNHIPTHQNIKGAANADQNQNVVDGVYKVVEQAPRFPGCEDKGTNDEMKKCADLKMLQFLFSNIKYPVEARKNNIEGRVVVSFVVEKDGSISGAKILKDIGGSCGDEAVRVVNLMNTMEQKWIPGKQDGNFVPVQFNLPIAFKLGEAVKPAAPITKGSTKLESTTLRLIPNPAHKSVEIQYHESKNVMIDIFDLAGRSMHKSSWDSFSGRQNIDISKLTSGTYIVKVSENGNISEQKLVVQ